MKRSRKGSLYVNVGQVVYALHNTNDFLRENGIRKGPQRNYR